MALYTDALEVDPENHVLLTNRAAAHLKLGQLDLSLTDAVKARELHPKWGKVSTTLTWMDTFGPKVAQMDPKWDKFETYSDQISVHFGLEAKMY